MTCLFCKIINNEIEAKFAYQDELHVGIYDINPKAPVHILLIPKKHIPTINDIGVDDINLIGDIVHKAKILATNEDIATSGYRLVWNVNKAAGQEVFHIHLHLLGGRSFEWPPG